jgi:hypothetical protein
MVVATIDQAQLNPRFEWNQLRTCFITSSSWLKMGIV